MPEPVAPSPKFQFIVYGMVPPVATAVNVNGELMTGFDGK